MTSKVYNVGIIGYGLSAKIFHIPFISVVPEFKLYAVVQRTPKLNDDVENDYPDAKCYRSVQEMLKDPQIDVVIVTTSPDTHLRLTKLALEAGKHGALSTLLLLILYMHSC
jgi:predicted dehydrogenase